MNISNAPPTNSTPTYQPLNLNQEIARLDREIEEIKFAYRFFEFMEMPRKVDNESVGVLFGVIYWTAIGKGFFTLSTEKKVMLIAIFFFAAAVYCLIAKYSPDMYQNFSRSTIKLHLNRGNNFSEDDLLEKIELI